MEVNRAIRTIKKNAEQIAANPRVSEKSKKAFLSFSEILIQKLKEYDEYDRAVEMLRGSQDRLDQLRDKVEKGEIPGEDYLQYMAMVSQAKKKADSFEEFCEDIRRVEKRINDARRKAKDTAIWKSR